MRLLLPGRFKDARSAFRYTHGLFEGVASGELGAVFSISPSVRHVGVTRKDTFRPGFDAAVRAAEADGYPVLVRSSGGGATAADVGTFGFSIVRPADGGEVGRGIRDRYDEATGLVLGAFERLGVWAEVGEVREEFCPGDQSIRLGGPEGVKIVGIAQRVTKKATSVGGIVLVHGEEDLARILTKVYGAMSLPFRPASVGSLRQAGYTGETEPVIEAFAREAEGRYAAERTPMDNEMMLGITRS